ncbi:MAG: hypothetical protein H5T97_10960 [Firmicutes bacterium]|nr:hypothetical protein [Bacillota bacterium]
MACPYRMLFHPTDDRGRTVPVPFALRPPLDERREIPAGEEVSFGMVLFGRAVDYLPLIIRVLEECGREGLGTGRAGYRL